MSQNFSALRHLPFEHHISTTVTLNLARPGPLETRHSEISKHIKCEENGAQKDPQTTTQRSDQNLKKKK